MRKYIVGFIAGVIIASATTQVYGGAVTLIGKKIQKEVEVNLLGEPLKNKAPLIDGTTYVPLREVTEKLGYKAVFKDGKVEISVLSYYDVQIKNKKEEIEEAKRRIKVNTEGIQQYEKLIADNPDKKDWLIDPHMVLAKKKEFIPTLEADLNKLESELAELEAQKAALEAEQ